VRVAANISKEADHEYVEWWYEW